MEPHRSNYPEESDPRRYRGEQPYVDPAAYTWSDPHTGEAAYRAQERRGGGRMPPGAPPGVGGAAGPWPVEPQLPPEMPGQRDPMQHQDPAAWEAQRTVARPSGPASSTVHRARRPAAAAIIGIGMAALALPVLRVLLSAAFGPTVSATGVISSALMLLGMPMAALGLYGLASGAAAIPGTAPSQAWLRPPVAYLLVALVLFVAAGLAAA